MLTQTPVRGGVPSTGASALLHRRGRLVFPAGITRATVECDPHPIYVNSGEGAHLVDVDGNPVQ